MPARRRFAAALIAVSLCWSPAVLAQTALPLEAPSATALLNGDYDGLRRMLFGGTDPNTHDTQRQPLIVLAARNGLDRGVEILLDNRARIDEADAFGNTALMWAADRGHDGIVRTLLKAGARPNLANKQGMTALIRAAREGQARSVEALLEAGADPNITDYTGRGALSWARDGRSRATIRALEAAGATE